MNGEDMFGFIIGIVMGLTVGGCMGDYRGRVAERSDAVKAAVGRYVTDAATGVTTFKYGKEEAK